VVDAAEAGAGADADVALGVLFEGADFKAGEVAVSAAVAGLEVFVSPGCAPSSLEAQQLPITTQRVPMIQEYKSRDTDEMTNNSIMTSMFCAHGC
jgi:hypothetical protein